MPYRSLTNPRRVSRITTRSLKPYRQVIRLHEKHAKQAKPKPHCSKDGPYLQQALRHRAVVSATDLRDCPHHKKDGEDAQKQNAPPAVPGVGGASPLQGQEEADQAWEEDCVADEVGFSHEFSPRDGCFWPMFLGEVDQEYGYEDGQGPEREVDPEAPSWDAVSTGAKGGWAR